MRKIGLDCDGVCVKEVSWPRWLPFFILKWLSVLAPAMPGIETARRIGREHDIVIVTARPAECLPVTRLWLRLHRLPVVGIHCVGLKGDKAPVLLEEKAEIFFDDKPRYIEAARSQGIEAHLFESWAQVATVLSRVERKEDEGPVR